MNKSLSIIVPVYNEEKNIKKCLDSILLAVLPERTEIIIIDDGSTDDSRRICEKIVKDNNNLIRLIHQENKGLCGARKRGIKESQGDYICFVDADDFVDKNFFIILFDNIVNDTCDFVHSGFMEDHESQTWEKNSGFVEGKYNLSLNRWKIIEEAICRDMISPSIWSKIFKKKLLEKTYMNQEEKYQFGEDVLCLLGCLLYADRIKIIKSCGYHYCYDDNSMSHEKSKKAVHNRFMLYDAVRKISEKSGKLDNLQIDEICISLLLRSLNSDPDKRISEYYLDNVDRFYGKRVAIYGAGKVGIDYYGYLRLHSNIDITGWYDTVPRVYDFAHIMNIRDIKANGQDYLIVANGNGEVADKMKDTALSFGIPKQCIICEEPKRRVKNLFGENL